MFNLYSPNSRRSACLGVQFRAWVLFAILGFASSVSGQTISFVDPPLKISPGQSVSIAATYGTSVEGIVQVQLFTAGWEKVAGKWNEVKPSDGAAKIDLNIEVPAELDAEKEYFWQAVLYDSQWKKQKEATAKGVVCGTGSVGESKQNEGMKESSAKPAEAQTIEAQPSGKLVGEESKVEIEWLPPGNWSIDWQDEFEGTGEPENWFPMLGYDPDAFAKNKMKGLRWTDVGEDSAWMYSTKTGNHWLDGHGNLILRMLSDKTDKNILGPKTKAAYLLSGFPEKWDESEPNNVKWGGKSVSAADGPIYICVRVKTNQLKGWSTWFAFWLFSQTRSYNDKPADGTEVDIIEIVKGKPDYMSSIFTVANHWKDLGDGNPGSESKMYNPTSKPKALDLVDVNDDKFHTYGILWSKEEMQCFVDGKSYYTFKEHIPTDPVDMFMMLTLEFKKNAWDREQGDGRTEGPCVWEDEKSREMSRVLVDFVRIYRQVSDK